MTLLVTNSFISRENFENFKSIFKIEFFKEKFQISKKISKDVVSEKEISFHMKILKF